MHLTATKYELPEKISLKAKMGWHYFYAGCDLLRTRNGYLLIAKNNKSLDEADAFMNEESFIAHLESKVDEILRTEDKIKFFARFVKFPELITPKVAEVLEKECLSYADGNNANESNG